MSEKRLYNRIKKYLPGAVSRVENLCDPGMPDTNGSCKQGDYWIEFKDADCVHPVINQDKLLDQKQRAWTVKRVRYGATVLLAVQYKQCFTISRARLFSEGLTYTGIFFCKGPLKKDKGKELTLAITGCFPIRGI